MLPWSGRDRGRPGEYQAAKVVRGLGGPAACCEECAFVGLEQFNPRRDLARVANVAVKAELRTEKRRTKFGDQFLCRVGARAEAVFHITIEA